ncbi:MAG: DUF3237 family protein [Actinobacteria bacterium]|uniref:Unannotated protein n=1 Tax=freshwater metagenome TaxID=449393 RepID=A0A6J7CNS4_9ZZZZ|nr:DUF3237 family protein [Actinomycetota bacterium]
MSQPFELVPLATVRVARGQIHRLGESPFGRRVIGAISDGRWEGERINASIVGAGGDWAIPSAGPIMILDVRQLLETDDGALIYVSYHGRCDRDRGTYTVAPTFETADERYAWLNAVQAVGQGRNDGDSIVYDMYEVR